MVGRDGGDAVSVSEGLAVDIFSGGCWLVKKIKRKRKIEENEKKNRNDEIFSFVCVCVISTQSPLLSFFVIIVQIIYK